MSKVIAQKYNNEELVKICYKLKCREDEIGRVIKSSLAGLKYSPFYRSQIDPEQSAKTKVDAPPPETPKKISEMTPKELYAKLHMTRKKEKAIMSANLYHQTNWHVLMGKLSRMHAPPQEVIYLAHSYLQKREIAQNLLRLGEKISDENYEYTKDMELF